MKVKLTRDHLEYKAGDMVDATPERLEYWKRVGLVKEHDKETKPIKKAPKQTKVTTPKKGKK